MSAEDFDLVSRLTPEQAMLQSFQLRCISPDDAKYADKADALRAYLTPEAEWRACVEMQCILLETRKDFGKAEQRHVDELRRAINEKKIDVLNIALLEKDKRIKHDQLAVLAELSRHVSPDVVSLLHPGTTSYDILDTVRSALFMGAWRSVIRPNVREVTEQFCTSAEKYLELKQVGRTHLQYTTPVTVGSVFGISAREIAECTAFLDRAFGDLRGKISGIVGTGASIEMVIGRGKALAFERAVLEKVGLEPDYAATQIVQKRRLATVGHGLVNLASALGGFAENIRRLYSSDIEEVTSLEHAARLGGSSAAAGKNNPIDWENIAGTVPIVESGMCVLCALTQSDHQRDLRGSKQARYQPQGMMTEVYDMFITAQKALPQLAFNEKNLAQHLQRYAEMPDEAMTAILRGEAWTHPEYGEGHSFVKHTMRQAKTEQARLLDVALRDPHFSALYQRLEPDKQNVLRGDMSLYLGAAIEKTRENVRYARALPDF